MAWTNVGEQDAARERLVRQATCPLCHARKGRRCMYETIDGRVLAGPMSHTARYTVAAGQGLVPAMPGQAP